MKPRTILIFLATVTSAHCYGALSALIPLATITGHGGLYGSGLMSAALMKLKAAAGIAALAKITESGFHFKIGHGWLPPDHDHHHHHGHHGHGGWGWSRKRRDTTETETAVAVDTDFDTISKYDDLGCGLRLVCELAASPKELNDDGKIILALFGNDADVKQKSVSKLSYNYARLLGAASVSEQKQQEENSNSNICARVYSKCPYASGDILGALRAVGV